MTQQRAGPCDITVLIADDDLFEADYVSSVLADRGIRVVGPIADQASAVDVVRTAGLCAAVVGGDSVELVGELARLGIPYLTLLRREVPGRAAGRPILTAPFAAYQVADWVVATLDRPTMA